MKSAKVVFAQLAAAGLRSLLIGARDALQGRRGAASFPYTPTYEEAHQYQLLTGKRPGRTRIALAELDEALQRHFLLSLHEVLAGGFSSFESADQRHEREEAEEQAWWNRLLGSLPTHPLVAAWIIGLQGRATGSGRWLRRHRHERASAAAAIQAVALGLANLPAAEGGYELLAVWANRLTGDPHTFDSDRPAGQLLLQALADRSEFAEWSEEQDENDSPVTVRERRALLLDQAGIGVDGVSSSVLVAHLAGANAEGQVHLVVAALAAHGGAWALPLREVRTWTAASARDQTVWVVENPPVFEALLSSVESLSALERPTLICTGGFFSASAVRLLALLSDGGARIRYSGDFDPNGIAIAGWVLERFAGAAPWRMGVGDYEMALTHGGRPLSERGQLSLGRVDGALHGLAAAVLERGKAAYQEGLVAALVADLVAGA